jgi:hypothetical protein
MTGRESGQTNASIKIAATPRDDPIVHEPQSHSAKGDFQTSGGFFITDEQICHAQCMRVECATR